MSNLSERSIEKTEVKAVVAYVELVAKKLGWTSMMVVNNVRGEIAGEDFGKPLTKPIEVKPSDTADADAKAKKNREEVSEALGRLEQMDIEGLHNG